MYWQGEGQWQQRMFGEGAAVSSAEETRWFYEQYKLMNDRASETTGETERELARLFNFADTFHIKGKILDAGSGTGERITEPFTRHLQERGAGTQVVGVDLREIVPPKDHQAKYTTGDLAALPFGDRSFDSIISTWSVINDVTERDEQLAVMAEFSRTLKEGGLLYPDVPFLEGGPGSWEKAATEYQEYQQRVYEAGQPFGAIVAPFRQGDTVVKKHFYIYPHLVLLSVLRGAGFQIENVPSKE